MAELAVCSKTANTVIIPYQPLNYPQDQHQYYINGHDERKLTHAVLCELRIINCNFLYCFTFWSFVFVLSRNCKESGPAVKITEKKRVCIEKRVEIRKRRRNPEWMKGRLLFSLSPYLFITRRLGIPLSSRSRSWSLDWLAVLSLVLHFLF